MKRVFQTTVCHKKGDCSRAAIASMFELDISQVPNFILFDEKTWFKVFFNFLKALGYEYKGEMRKDHVFYEHDLINDCIYAGVPSKTFEGTTHAVLINSAGRVIHDPNPNRLWLDVNIKATGDLLSWWSIEKME